MSIQTTTAASSLWTQASTLLGTNVLGKSQSNAAQGADSFFADIAAQDSQNSTNTASASSLLPSSSTPIPTPSPASGIPGTATASTGFYAQSIAQGGNTAPSQTLADDGGTAAAGQSAADKFKAFVNENPMERLRDQIMHEMGTTQADINSMTPAEQDKIEAEIKQKVQETLKKQVVGAAAQDPAGMASADLAAAV